MSTETTDLFDAAAMHDDDCLHFFTTPGAPTHGPVVGTAYTGASQAADVVWRLLELRPGMTVLDPACGHGALAIALAARGCRVTGLDSSAVFLYRADAAAAGADGLLGRPSDLDRRSGPHRSACPRCSWCPR